jgi:hypothetical protein
MAMNPANSAKAMAHEVIQRTLEVVQAYHGPRDATLLLNCLLGLLVVPNEKLFEEIPTHSLDTLNDWGINPNAITKRVTCRECRDEYPRNLRQLVMLLRHSVAHFNILPVNDRGVWVGVTLSNSRTGFECELTFTNMRTFVSKLAEYLQKKTSKNGQGRGKKSVAAN